MSVKLPIVSIGMPLYNEEQFLPQALDSLLTQDHGEFELIISDNGSQDATREICLDYGARDARIRYFRDEANLGAVKNFSRVFLLASGQFFVWAAGHDLWHHSYISRCLEVLFGDPAVSLCYTQIAVIGPHGESLECVREGIDTRGLDAFGRFRATLWGLVRIPFSDPIYGLMRSDCLRRTHLARNLWGADNMVLLELGLTGAIAQIKEPLYYRRLNRDRTAGVEHWTERYLEALDPANRKKRMKLTYSQMCYGYMSIVHRSPFTRKQKVELVVDIWRSVLGRFWRGFIFHDVICGSLRLLLGDRGVCLFKQCVYSSAKGLGLYK